MSTSGGGWNVPLKQPVKTAIVINIHYFHAVFEHGLPRNLNLNHNAYSIFLRIHVRRESMARSTKVHFNFARACEWHRMDKRKSFVFARQYKKLLLLKD